MNQYGRAAQLAASRTLTASENPLDHWRLAMERISESTESRKKNCPKEAFLGLCEEGLVRGFPPGKYTSRRGGNLNKNYAMRAVAILQDSDAPTTPMALWKSVIGDQKKRHNGQMDVVFALKRDGLISSAI